MVNQGNNTYHLQGQDENGLVILKVKADTLQQAKDWFIENTECTECTEVN